MLITAADMELFKRASHDANSLHCSAAYARLTPFGQPVAYGVLAAVEALAALSVRPEGELATLSIDFLAPTFVGMPYRVSVEEDEPGKAKVRLLDGRRTTLRLKARFRPRGAASITAASQSGATRASERDWTDTDLVAGLAVKGRYVPDGEAMQDLDRQLGLVDRGLTAPAFVALLACSYLVGMELPGRRALLSKLELVISDEAILGVTEYEAKLVSVDDRFGLATIEFEIRGQGRTVARGLLGAFVRRQLAPADGALVRANLVPSRRLENKVVLIIGASRGLGAAFAHAFASQAACVIGTYRSSESAAEALRAAIERGGGVFVPTPSDANSLAACRELRRQVLEQHGRLDVLVLNACPPLLPLSLDPESSERITAHIAESVAMATVPLACLVDLVERSNGDVVFVSSTAVTTPPPEWPHYVTAKHALEGLAQVTAAAHRGLRVVVVRPPRLMTDLTNTPLVHTEPQRPELVASGVVTALLARSPSEPRPLIITDGWFGAAAGSTLPSTAQDT